MELADVDRVSRARLALCRRPCLARSIPDPPLHAAAWGNPDSRRRGRHVVRRSGAATPSCMRRRRYRRPPGWPGRSDCSCRHKRDAVLSIAGVLVRSEYHEQLGRITRLYGLAGAAGQGCCARSSLYAFARRIEWLSGESCPAWERRAARQRSERPGERTANPLFMAVQVAPFGLRKGLHTR
jgi:hypothetical protein